MKFEEIFGPDKCNLIFTLEITNKKNLPLNHLKKNERKTSYQIL